MGNEQDDLFNRFQKARPLPPDDDYPRGPGHRGVDTSIAAANSVKAAVPFMRMRITSFLVDCGSYGAIYTDIANRCRMEVPTVCGRMKELTEDGTVKVSVRRRKTPSGRSARVYVHRSFWNPSTDEAR